MNMKKLFLLQYLFMAIGIVFTILNLEGRYFSNKVKYNI